MLFQHQPPQWDFLYHEIALIESEYPEKSGKKQNMWLFYVQWISHLRSIIKTSLKLELALSFPDHALFPFRTSCPWGRKSYYGDSNAGHVV